MKLFNWSSNRHQLLFSVVLLVTFNVVNSGVITTDRAEEPTENEDDGSSFSEMDSLEALLDLFDSNEVDISDQHGSADSPQRNENELPSQEQDRTSLEDFLRETAQQINSDQRNVDNNKAVQSKSPHKEPDTTTVTVPVNSSTSGKETVILNKELEPQSHGNVNSTVEQSSEESNESVNNGTDEDDTVVIEACDNDVARKCSGKPGAEKNNGDCKRYFEQCLQASGEENRNV